jgi:membrane protease YdiL (CAAX protease family)
MFPLCVMALVAFLLIGCTQNTINVTWHIVPILLLYPLWGIVQQFLVIAMVGGNLKAINPGKAQTIVNIIVTAALFGAIHYPYHWLMAGTFILAIVYGIIYYRSPNLIVLGLFHGWLGALFFYTVVNRDPYLEIFGRM